MQPSPLTLRAYANIFELQRRDPRTGLLDPPGELSTAAAKALRFQADALEARAQEVARYELRTRPEDDSSGGMARNFVRS